MTEPKAKKRKEAYDRGNEDYNKNHDEDDEGLNDQVVAALPTSTLYLGIRPGLGQIDPIYAHRPQRALQSSVKIQRRWESSYFCVEKPPLEDGY